MKLSILTLGLAMSLTLAWAQTSNVVVSANVVGMISLAVPGATTTDGNLMIVSAPLNPPGAGTNDVTMTLDELIGTKMHANTSINNADQVLLWSNNQYLTAFLNSNGGSDTNKWYKWCYLIGQARALCATNSAFDIYPGRAFWIRNRGGSLTLPLIGEAPSGANNPVPVDVGLNMIANPYPVEVHVQDLITVDDGAYANTSINNADQMIFWTGAEYMTTFLNSTGGSDPNKHYKWCYLVGQTRVVATNMVQPGEGFWYRRRGTGPFIWAPLKPYTDP